MKLLDFYSNLKDKIEDDEVVKENFQNIFAKFKRSASASSNREAVEELEKKFFAGEKIQIAKNAIKNAASNVKTNKTKMKSGIKRNFSKMKDQNANDDHESIEESESEVNSVNHNNLNTNRKNNRNNIANSSGLKSNNLRYGLRKKSNRGMVEDEESDEDNNQDSDF